MFHHSAEIAVWDFLNTQLQGRTQGGTGVLPPMAAWSSTVNNIVVSEEAIPSAENSGNLWAVGAPPWTPLGELTALPETPRLAAPSPRTAPTSLVFGLDFRLFGLGPNEKFWARPCTISCWRVLGQGSNTRPLSGTGSLIFSLPLRSNNRNMWTGMCTLRRFKSTLTRKAKLLWMTSH